MILHQTSGSARVARCTGHMARCIARLLLTSLLVSAMTLLSIAAWASPQGKSSPAISEDSIKLPPIPQLDSLPRIKWNALAPALKTDILIEPSAPPSRSLQTPQDREHMATN
jgi:hypothetical protein